MRIYPHCRNHISDNHDSVPAFMHKHVSALMPRLVWCSLAWECDERQAEVRGTELGKWFITAAEKLLISIYGRQGPLRTSTRVLVSELWRKYVLLMQPPYTDDALLVKKGSQSDCLVVIRNNGYCQIVTSLYLPSQYPGKKAGCFSLQYSPNSHLVPSQYTPDTQLMFCSPFHFCNAHLVLTCNAHLIRCVLGGH